MNPSTTPPRQRALPAWVVDLIRDGVSPRDLKARGGQAIWSALVRTAMSAYQCGHTRPQWEAFVTEPRSRLGHQLLLRDARRARTPRAVADTLTKAWDTATARVADDPTRTWRQTHEEAAERAEWASRLADDPEVNLTHAERKVLRYAAAQTAQRQMLRVALPRRAVMAATELGERTVRTALEGLAAKGVLELVERGQPRGDRAKRARAALYALPATLDTHNLYPETGFVGPPVQVCGTPTNLTYGTPLSESPVPVAGSGTDLPRCPQCNEGHGDRRPYRICSACVAAGRFPTVCAHCGGQLSPRYRTSVHEGHIHAERKARKLQEHATQAAQHDARAVWRGTDTSVRSR